VIANLSSTCVCQSFVPFLPIILRLSPFHLFLLSFFFYGTLISTPCFFRSFFPFTVFIRFPKGSKAFFFPTVQLLTGTLRVVNAIARLNTFGQKGSKTRLDFNTFAFLRIKFDRVRTIVVVAVVIILYTFLEQKRR